MAGNNKNKNKNKQKQKRRAPRRRKQNNQQLVKHQQHVKLSSCAVLYARALVDPFSFATSQKNLPCVPDSLYLQPGYRFMSWVRCGAVGNSTTAGVSGVFAPWNMANDLKTNSTAAVLTTQSNYTGALVMPTTEATTGVNGFALNSPYATADIGQDTQFRLVAAGMKITCTSTNYAAKGNIYLVRHPGNADLSGDGIAEVNKWETTEVHEVSHGKSYYVKWAPLLATDYTYSSTMTGTSHPIGFITDGGDANQSFFIECRAFYEVIGAAARGKTRSESDPVAFGEINAAASSTHHNDTDINKFLRKVARGIKDTTSYVLDAGSKYGGQFVGNAIAGYENAQNGTPMLTNGPIVTEA